MLKHLITELCQQFQLPMNLEINPQGYYEIALNETTDLLFKELYPGFTCRSVLAPVPQKPSEDLFILLMKANFLGQGTKGSSIAIDDAVQNFLFTLSVPEEVNYRLFKERLEEFINYLEYWKKRIHDEILPK
jgi:hypothetical protein